MIKTLLNKAITRLKAISNTPRLDAELLLTHILNESRSYLHTHADLGLTKTQVGKFEKLLRRREEGEPIAYILGRKEFWSLELEVDSDVLIPRPETELLIELTLQRFPQKTNIKFADLGTGSGAIALAVASERSGWQFFATDQDPRALKIAQRNARNLAIKNIKFLQGNWCDVLPDCDFNIIVSNPPYVAANDPHLLHDIRFEPTEALVAQDNGLADIKKIILQAREKLGKKGTLMLEHGFEQGEVVRQFMMQNGYTDVFTHKDLAGQERVSLGMKLNEKTTK